jgi:hypothetical protein
MKDKEILNALLSHLPVQSRVFMALQLVVSLCKVQSNASAQGFVGNFRHVQLSHQVLRYLRRYENDLVGNRRLKE